MKAMSWSWDELQSTPKYVRMACWDFHMIDIKAQNERNERANRDATR